MHRCRCERYRRAFSSRAQLNKMMLVFFFILLAQLCSAAPTLFVVQTLDESAATIDLTTEAVNQHATTLGTIPNDVIVHRNRVYVANSGYNNIQEIDAETAETIREIQVPGGVNVWSMAMLNDDTVAVTCSVSNNVVVIRLSDEAVVGTLSAGVAPQSILVNGDYFYVGVTGVSYPVFGPASVFVFDRFSLSRVDSLPVAVNPQGLAVDDQNRLHIVCTGDYANQSGKVDVIDLATRELVTELSVGGTPSNISIGNGVAYLAAGGWGTDGYVYTYRVSDLSVLHDAGNPLTTGSGAFDVEARPDGSFWVSCFNIDVVEHRDEAGSLIRSYELSDGPAQLALYEGTQEVSHDFPVVPESIVLANVYPNPFNSEIEIRLNSITKTSSNIHIYNCIGQHVRTLSVPIGRDYARWNGRDDSGNALSSGVYIANFAAGLSFDSKRMILLK